MSICKDYQSNPCTVEGPKPVSIHILELIDEIKDLSDDINQDSYSLRLYFQGGLYSNESKDPPPSISGFYEHIEKRLLEIKSNLIDIKINIKDTK